MGVLTHKFVAIACDAPNCDESTDHDVWDDDGGTWAWEHAIAERDWLEMGGQVVSDEHNVPRYYCEEHAKPLPTPSDPIKGDVPFDLPALAGGAS